MKNTSMVKGLKGALNRARTLMEGLKDMAAKKKTAAKKPAARKTGSQAARKGWEAADEKLFKQLHKAGTPTAQIAKQLGRSTAAVRSKAQKFGLSLKPKAAKRAKR